MATESCGPSSSINFTIESSRGEEPQPYFRSYRGEWRRRDFGHWSRICDFLRHAVIEDLKTIAAETVNITSLLVVIVAYTSIKRTSTLIVPDDCGQGQQKRPGERGTRRTAKSRSNFSSLFKRLS